MLGTLANSEDPDEMQHISAFHQGLHSLLRLKESSGTDIRHNLGNSSCAPLKFTMASPLLIVGKSIQIQKINSLVQ